MMNYGNRIGVVFYRYSLGCKFIVHFAFERFSCYSADVGEYDDLGIFRCLLVYTLLWVLFVNKVSSLCLQAEDTGVCPFRCL